jgi:dihydroorotate dehydrogenase (fumarate)
MENVGADVLELNFCCPNMTFSTDEKTGAKVGTHLGRVPATMAKIVSAMKAELKTPIWVKATGTNIEYTISAKAIVAAGADGLITNGAQLVVPPIDIYNGGRTSMPTMGNNSLGAAVGPVNRLHANRLICTASRECDVPIAGGGGISQWEHIVETIMFGASLTQICTKFLWDGFDDIPKMNEQLLKFMKNQGYATIADMRGIALKHLVMGDKLEFIESMPEIDGAKCVGCGACAKIGSCTALQMEGKKALFEAKKCVSCGLCAALCPTKAISFADA